MIKSNFLDKLIISFSILFFFACDEPGDLGLEIQPNSDKIEIFNSLLSQSDSDSYFSLTTQTVDSLRSDEPSSLLLGRINDPVFGENSALFATMLSLAQSNIDLGSNPIVDSVVMSYSYSGYYGDILSLTEINVDYTNTILYKDSVYYSNYQLNNSSGSLPNLLTSFSISPDTSNSPNLRMTLDNSIGQQILDFGNSGLIDNETFQNNFGALLFDTYSSLPNCIIYLNPSGSNSFFKIYYHNDTNDSLSIDFVLDAETPRLNLFNEKSLSNLQANESRSYIQSMAGFKTQIELKNMSLIDSILNNKAINQVTLSFNAISDNTYSPHQNLSLVRVDENGNNVFLKDFTVEGATHFGGELANDSYEFNITRYFGEYLNNDSYTDELYLLANGAVINASRTVIDDDSFIITILYSDL